ncbi:hypothetical protein DFH28DRAFT_1179775 [Melampsora americana]|nr:hypothetical protein DFH28DRAFT_1179775 [Melampsora americana]
MPLSAQHGQSPYSNHDHLASSILPRVRSASSAFGNDRITSSDRRPISPRWGDSAFGDEANYRECPDGNLGTPSTIPSSLHGGLSRVNSQEHLSDPRALSNMIDNIRQQFGLDPSQNSEIERVYKQQPSDQARQIAMICFLKSELIGLERRIGESIITATNKIRFRVSNDRTNWTSNETVQKFIRESVKDLLIGSSIQGYSTTHTAENEPILDSLENLLIDKLIDTENKIDDADLPEDFRNDDPSAEHQVRRLVKEIAKSEKNKYQNLILKHIKDPPNGSLVPNLCDLLFLRSKDTLWRTTSIADKTRLALLRLEGAIFNCQPKDSTIPRTTRANRERSMWDRVDDRLAWVATLSPDTQKAFYRWILQYDRKVFTGNQTFELIKGTHNLSIITPEELESWILDGEPRLV